MTNLPAPGSERAQAKEHAPADLVELVRLFGLRIWVEQSYKQAKLSLGWGDYQVRSDRAIRRHWALVWCAFSFCWHHAPPVLWADAPSAGEHPAAAPPTGDAAPQPATATVAGWKKNQPPRAVVGAPRSLVASCAAGGAGVAGALDHAVALLARLVGAAPTAPALAPPP